MKLNTDNLTYSIGQVSDIAQIAQSTLRYWETVFERLNPYKTPGGSRRYNKDDIELVLLIKELLYDKKYTIKGANLYLNNPSDIKPEHVDENTINDEYEDNSQADYAAHQPGNSTLMELLNELKRIRKILD